MCTVWPTVQLPLAAKVTARPEDAVALTAKSGSPNFLVESGGRNSSNVIVWLALAIENVCEMLGAALNVASPAWDAVTVHEPAPVMCTVNAITVHAPMPPNDEARPEDVTALTVKSASPKVLIGSAPNPFIAWSIFAPDSEISHMPRPCV